MMKRSQRLGVLGAVMAVGLFAGGLKCFADPSSEADKWNQLLGNAYGGNGGWVPREKEECSASKEEFVALVRRTLENIHPKLEVLRDDEFNKTQKPEVLSGIRLKCVDYPDSEGGFLGIGCTRFYELTQCYIRLLEPEGGKAHFLILTRSARHKERGDNTLTAYSPPPGDPKATAPPQPRQAPQIAKQIKTQLMSALLAKDNAPPP